MRSEPRVVFQKAAAIAVVAAALVLPGVASAQQVIDPTRAEFNPSADHNTVLPDGSAAVQSYRLDLFLVGASAPFQSVSLGKPNPDPDGIIRVDLTSIFAGWPIPGTNYTADVAAVGPGGSSPSALSNTFSFTTQCVATVSPLTVNAAAGPSTATATVTAASSCSWMAISNASWITVTAGANGSGNGSVSYSVAANTATTSRTGTMTIAGQTVTITQSGAPCTFTVAPTSATVADTASTGSVTVTAGTGCSWTAASNVSWITITAGASGSGNGSVSYL